MKPAIQIKRIYEKPLKADGFRILVDRLWPRSLSVEEAAIDFWAKQLAPSVTLRKWFNHDPDFWLEFQRKYKYELRRNKNIDSFVERYSHTKKITLLYGAKDKDHNHALVLKEFLQLKFDDA